MGAMTRNEEWTTDPCSAENTFSGPRFLAFAFLFIAMLAGGSILFFLLGDTAYGNQLASVVSYTSAVLLYGFAKNRSGIRPYLFTCPVVMSQYPRLLNRHAAFLTVLVAFETVAFKIKPHLSAWWLTASGRNVPPFVMAVAVPCMILAIAEIVTNRALLERAHVDRFGDRPEEIASEQDGTLSLLGRK
ncbi:MAG: hypothetical protein RB191_22595 [Terriglobia bacterium]|nr:hypothetical protein [Terriglobia bacterium]